MARGKSQMDVLFLGFQTWGLVTLKAIVEAGHRVQLVATHPEPTEAVDRHFNDSVVDYCKALGLPCLVAPTLQDDFDLSQHITQPPDILVASNWRRRIPGTVISMCRMGGINVHRSLLPNYAGLAPLNRAVANGESSTGVTIHLLSDELDLGDIVVQEPIAIDANDTATSLFLKTGPVISRLIPVALDGLSTGSARLQKQRPEELVFYHKRGERELRIDWSRPASAIHNLVRAQSPPFMAAYTQLEDRRLSILRTSLPPSIYRGTPSRIVGAHHVPPGIVVICGESPNTQQQGLILEQVSLDGAPPVPARSAKLPIGGYLS